MSTTWFLVAHRAGARICAMAGPRSPLEIVERIDHPAGRLRNRDIDADSHGRSVDSLGNQRHAYATEHSPTEHLAEDFARELADRLRSGRLKWQYERLVLVAGPKLLGHLRHALDASTAALVKSEISKDLAEVPDQDLREALAASL